MRGWPDEESYSCYARLTCDAGLLKFRTPAARHRDRPARSCWPVARSRWGRMVRCGPGPAPGGVGRRVSGALLFEATGDRQGAGGSTDRMLDDLLDRLWHGGPCPWWRGWPSARPPASRSAALAALNLSFIAGYIRARRGESARLAPWRSGTVTEALATCWLSRTCSSDGRGRCGSLPCCPGLAAAVQAGQVAQEERAA